MHNCVSSPLIPALIYLNSIIGPKSNEFTSAIIQPWFAGGTYENYASKIHWQMAIESERERHNSMNRAIFIRFMRWRGNDSFCAFAFNRARWSFHLPYSRRSHLCFSFTFSSRCLFHTNRAIKRCNQLAATTLPKPQTIATILCVAVKTKQSERQRHSEEAESLNSKYKFSEHMIILGISHWALVFAFRSAVWAVHFFSRCPGHVLIFNQMIWEKEHERASVLLKHLPFHWHPT